MVLKLFSDMHFGFFLNFFTFFLTLLSYLVFHNKLEKQLIATNFWVVICDC